MVADQPDWEDFRDLEEELDLEDATLLLGNGFSIGASDDFHYSSLYEKAQEIGLPEVVEEIFDDLGTTNFELVMDVLDDPDEAAGYYPEGTDPAQMKEDLRDLQEAFVDAIHTSHIERRANLTPWEIQHAKEFLQKFGTVLTTNYDLIPYWLIMHGDGDPSHQDGFRREGDGDERLIYMGIFDEGERTIHYLHGALHLHHEGEVTVKLEAGEARLRDAIDELMDKGHIPLIVSEGNHEEKIERIKEDPYLRAAFRRLSNVEGTLVTYGHSLSDQDMHILNAIAHNENLEKLIVGAYSGPGTDSFDALVHQVDRIQEKRAELGNDPLEVRFYESSTAGVWWAPIAAGELEQYF